MKEYPAQGVCILGNTGRSVRGKNPFVQRIKYIKM